MATLSRVLVALLCGSAAAAATPACCAYSGTGSAVVSGVGTMDLGTGRGAEVIAMVIAASPTANPPFVSVLINSSIPESSAAGWHITTNATGQLLTAWNAQSQACGTTFMPSSQGVYVPGFALCPGAAGGLFPDQGDSYTLGDAVLVNTYAQGPGTGSTGSFLGPTQNCALVAVLAPGSPISQGGAFSFLARTGSSAVPPASMGSVPSWC